MDVVITLVYSKFTKGEIMQLLEDLNEVSMDFQMPWIVGGNFHVITSEEAKLGGLPVI